MIDEKYKTRSLGILNPDEQLRELNEKRHSFQISLFKIDVDASKKQGINIGRILRFKFHDWLIEKGVFDENE